MPRRSRIRGVQHQRIYRIDPNCDYGSLTSLVSRADQTIDTEQIAEQWDRMGQLYASLKTGHVTVSVALKRLVNEVIIQGSVFVGMLQVQRAGFDPTLNVQEEQRLIEGYTEFALLLDCCPLLRIEEAGRCRFIDRAVFLFEVLNGVY